MNNQKDIPDSNTELRKIIKKEKALLQCDDIISNMAAINLDLEGFEDLDMEGNPSGVMLPYIVTIDQNSGKKVNEFKAMLSRINLMEKGN